MHACLRVEIIVRRDVGVRKWMDPDVEGSRARLECSFHP